MKLKIVSREAAAVQWAHNVQRPDGWTYYSQASVVNLARAALRWREERDDAIKRADEAEGALRELAANVRGECPSLLNEDSGGDWKLSMRIDAILEARHE